MARIRKETLKPNFVFAQKISLRRALPFLNKIIIKLYVPDVSLVMNNDLKRCLVVTTRSWPAAGENFCKSMLMICNFKARRRRKILTILPPNA